MWIALTKNKTFEISFVVDAVIDIFDFSFKWTRKCDHAGLTLDVYILGIWFMIGIQDNRHWNDSAGAWEDPGHE